MAHVSSLAREERGGILVLVAVALPVLVLFVSFVVDVGDWFAHKRHLQMQADAGALAGAGLFNLCFASQSSGDATIESTARTYAGDPTTSGAVNHQLGGTSAGPVAVRINKRTFVSAPPAADDTVEQGPCEASMLDVKLSESGAPTYFNILGGLNPTINARARVEIRTLDTFSGLAPIGVPNANPVSARITFVDEANGNVLGATDLARDGFSSGGLFLWNNKNALATINLPSDASKDVGVRVALSGTANATDCAAPLTECYDLTRANGGISHMRAWSATPDGSGTNPPNVRAVHLDPIAGCAEAHFFSDLAPCTSVRMRATIDIGTHTTASTTIVALGAGCPNKGCTLTFSAANNDWEGTIPLSSTTDRVWLDIGYTIKSGKIGSTDCTKGGGCSGTVAQVQRVFGADPDLSGAVKQITVLQPGPLGTVLDALQKPASGSSATTNVFVQIALAPGFRNAQDYSPDGDVSKAPLTTLRVVGKTTSGGKQPSIDCDPAQSKLRDELANGCAPNYTVNTGQACPAYNVLWSTAQPWFCVKTDTGDKTGQLTKGMDTRILGSGTCADHPNKWPKSNGIGWAPAPTDTRVVPVFLTPFGTFSNPGNDVYPVTQFAVFYLTGWGHNGGGKGCAGDDDAPTGTIVGHFIRYINPPSKGHGTDPCVFDPAALGTCVAVMTR
jgi:Flp pilus assembly protein TadG